MAKQHPFKTHHNATPDPGQIMDPTSETVPDQSMTIREIMENHARGLPIGGQRVPSYHEEDSFIDELPDMQGLDLSERAELAERHAVEVDRLRENLAVQQRPKGPTPVPDNPTPPASDAGQTPPQK